MALDRLVEDPDRLRKVWDTDYLHSAGLGPFDDVFGLTLAEDLVIDRGLRIPYLRLLKDGAYVPAARWTHRTGTGAGTADGVVESHALLREVEDGATIVLRGLVRYCPSLADFCAELSTELGFAQSAGAYLTPAWSRGAGPHHDPMSVLVRQVHGVKHWRITPPGSAPIELMLRPGESLYLPRGFEHDAWTTDEQSIHITFSGDTPPTFADVLRDLVTDATAPASLGETFGWRFGDDPDALAAGLTDAIERLRTHLGTVDTRRLADELITTHAALPAPAPRGRLGAALARPGSGR